MKPNAYLKYFLVLTGLALVVFCIKAFGNHMMFFISLIMLSSYAWAVSKVAVDEYGLVEGTVVKSFQKKIINHLERNLSAYIAIIALLFYISVKVYTSQKAILIAESKVFDTKYLLAE